MQEILFKAKKIADNKWVEGLLHYNAAKCCHQIVEFVQHGPTMSEPAGNQFNLFHDILISTLCEYTGKVDGKGRRIFENDIYFEEIEEDKGDKRLFYICTWIKEAARFVWLSPNEYFLYNVSGLGNIDTEGMENTFSLEVDPRLHYKGPAIDNPKILEI